MTEQKKVPRARLEEHLNRLAQTILRNEGFRSDGVGALREFDGGAQYFAIAVTDAGQRNEINPFGQTGLVKPHQIHQHFFGPKRKLGLGQFQVEFGHFSGVPNQGKPCQTQAELVATEVWLQGFLRNEMVPCLERYSLPQAILQAYLKHDETQKNTIDVLSWKGWGSAVVGLIYARLYGPEHYEDLKRRYERIFALLRPEYRQQVDALVRYLDKETLAPLQS